MRLPGLAAAPPATTNSAASDSDLQTLIGTLEDETRARGADLAAEGAQRRGAFDDAGRRGSPQRCAGYRQQRDRGAGRPPRRGAGRPGQLGGAAAGAGQLDPAAADRPGQPAVLVVDRPAGRPRRDRRPAREPAGASAAARLAGRSDRSAAGRADQGPNQGVAGLSRRRPCRPDHLHRGDLCDLRLHQLLDRWRNGLPATSCSRSPACAGSPP